jgi:hypothetical protein
LATSSQEEKTTIKRTQYQGKYERYKGRIDTVSVLHEKMGYKEQVLLT